MKLWCVRASEVGYNLIDARDKLIKIESANTKKNELLDVVILKPIA